MLERHFRRATYDSERGTFVVEDAGWRDGQPVIEYGFAFFDDGNDVRSGVLEKRWLDERDLVTGEAFEFGEFDSQRTFQAAVRQILAEAKARADQENLDTFLAVIDIVKERSVQSNTQTEEDVIGYEGLFTTGPEDGYTRRSLQFFGEDRLHDRVIRSKDECWRLHIGQVADPTGNPLGWVLCVLLYPDLTSAASDAEIEAATCATLLDLDHWHNRHAAVFAQSGFQKFMDTGLRTQDPELAHMNDSDVFELICVQMAQQQIIAPIWDTLAGDEIRQFIDGQHAITRQRSDWYPNKSDAVQEYVEQSDLTVHEADQVEAYLLDVFRLRERFSDDSPWSYLDGDEADRKDEAGED